MKKLGPFIFLYIPFFFFSCKTPPVTDFASSLTSQVKLDDKSGLLKIYFPEFYDKEGKVYAGDGIVIVFPDNKVSVIDGFVKKAAEEYISFIKSLGISKIDYLIATHFHNDHIGTFPELLKEFEIGAFYSNGAPIQSQASSALLYLLEKYKIPKYQLRAGDNLKFSNEFYADILWPTLSIQDIYDIYNNPGKTAAKINLSSLVLRFQFGEFSIMFPGDIYKKGDKALSKQFGNKLKTTILKAPHHGEWYTANSYRFIKNVSPDYAVIQDNRYITRTISNLYKTAGSKILYRLTPGYILIESDGKAYSISEKTFPEEMIRTD